MISRTRTDILAPLCLFLGIILVSLLGFSLLAHASAMPIVTPAVADPGGLLGLLLAGHYLPAIGAGMVIFVGLARAGAGSFWPWLQTRLGGYVLAYVTSYALYLGTAWQAGAPWDVHLLLTAFTAALAASGVLEHWKDILAALTGSDSKAAKVNSAAVLALIILGVTSGLALGGAACGPKTKALESAVWDCSAPARADAVAAVTPTVISVIRAAGSADGKMIDTSTVRSAISKANVLSEAGVLLSCAFASAVAILETPMLSPAAGSPASSPYELDPAAVAKVWAEINASQLGGAHFLVASGRVL